MNKQTVKAFNAAFAGEPTKREARLVSDLITLWGKLGGAAAKQPATIRRAIIFGMALQKAITAGEIDLPEERITRKKNKPQETTTEGTAEE